jgi:hypothetical protein
MAELNELLLAAAGVYYRRHIASRRITVGEHFPLEVGACGPLAGVMAALMEEDVAAACGPPDSRAAGLAMAFKLIEAAQDRWRAVNGPTPGPPRPRGRPVRQRQAHRTTRRNPAIRSRVKIFIHRS